MPLAMATAHKSKCAMHMLTVMSPALMHAWTACCCMCLHFDNFCSQVSTVRLCHTATALQGKLYMSMSAYQGKLLILLPLSVPGIHMQIHDLLCSAPPPAVVPCLSCFTKEDLLMPVPTQLHRQLCKSHFECTDCMCYCMIKVVAQRAGRIQV